MNQDLLAIAEAYCAAMSEKNLAGLEQYLHPDVQFMGPLGQASGKKAYLEATEGFMGVFKAYTVRKMFSSGNQVMVVYDVDFPEPIGQCRTAGLMTFSNELIIGIELFFDARPFSQEKAASSS